MTYCARESCKPRKWACNIIFHPLATCPAFSNALIRAFKQVPSTKYCAQNPLNLQFGGLHCFTSTKSRYILCTHPDAAINAKHNLPRWCPMAFSMQASSMVSLSKPDSLTMNHGTVWTVRVDTIWPDSVPRFVCSKSGKEYCASWPSNCLNLDKTNPWGAGQMAHGRQKCKSMCSHSWSVSQRSYLGWWGVLPVRDIDEIARWLPTSIYYLLVTIPSRSFWPWVRRIHHQVIWTLKLLSSNIFRKDAVPR